MERIASFSIDHLKLVPGVYVSRKDRDPETGCIITTFDIRMTAPNREPVMDTAAVHALEHLLATYLRNDAEWSDRVVYFGPMGCRTGCYLVMFGDLESSDILPLLRDAYRFTAAFEGEVPGALPEECGNWHDSDLPMARWWAARFLEQVLDRPDVPTVYPEFN